MPRTVTRYIGRCGVCEGDFKLLGGRLVHHGYRRPGHGYIVGDCFAVGYEPLERSTAASAEYREGCEKGRDGLRNYLGRLERGEVHELTVYRTVYEAGYRKEITEIVRDSDANERYRFEEALRIQIRETTRRIEWLGEEIARMSRLINDWVERPIRTVEEFERAVAEVLKEERTAREAERSARRQARDDKRSALEQKRAQWENEKRELMDKYRALFTEYAAESPPNKRAALAAWTEMHRAKKRKGYLEFWPRALEIDEALIKLGLARRAHRHSGEYTEYASSYGYGVDR